MSPGLFRRQRFALASTAAPSGWGSSAPAEPFSLLYTPQSNRPQRWRNLEELGDIQ